MEQNWLPQVKFLGSYTIPKIDVQLGGSFQSIPGVEYAASYAAPNTDLARPVAQGGLGRLPTGGVATGTTNRQPDPAGRHLRPALQPDRPASGQEPPVRRTPGGGQPGHLQHPELGHDQRRQRHVLHLAGAAERRRAATDEGVGDVRLLSTATPSREVHCPAPLRRGGARGNRSLSAPGFRLPACFKAPAHGLSRQSLDPQSGATVATVSPVVFSLAPALRVRRRANGEARKPSRLVGFPV